MPITVGVYIFENFFKKREKIFKEAKIIEENYLKKKKNTY